MKAAALTTASTWKGSLSGTLTLLLSTLLPMCRAGSDLWLGNPMATAPAAARMTMGASMAQSKLLEAAAAAAGLCEPGSSSSNNLYTELLPAGCAPDAYKLFVGNVPKSFTEEELRPVGAAAASVLRGSVWGSWQPNWLCSSCAQVAVFRVLHVVPLL